MLRLKLVFQVIMMAATVSAAQKMQSQAISNSLLRPVSFSEGNASYSSSASEEPEPPAALPPAPYKSELPSGPERFRPFSSLQLGIKASLLGGGLDLATPLTRRFDLRGQANFVRFKYLFNIDGVDYNSHFNLLSGSLGVDWYPTRHSLRISPGVLYFNNHVEAISGVPPGDYFELGSTGFINSVDDPLNGDAKIIFDRHIAPMLLIGFNLIGHRQSRFTVPVEIGAAYTGAAKIDVTLNGTACTNEGCFTFADNQEAQQSMQEEIAKLNRRLSSVPVYPILSIGFAYRYGNRR